MKAAVALLCALLLSAASQADQRVVSIDGSITEIIYALGAEVELVAVDTTSRYPAAAQQLPDVGYMRQLSVEGILALQPTLVLATTEAGPEAVFTQLQQAGVKVIRIDNQHSVAGVMAKIHTVAAALNRAQAGQQLATQLQTNIDRALAHIPATAGPRTLFLLGGGNRGYMAAGQHTQADAMLALVKAPNIFAHHAYKPISAEALLKANPEVVLIAQTGPAASDLSTQLAMTDAARNQRIHTVDTSLVLGFGPRLDQGITTLIELLYPTAQHTQGSAQ